MRRRTYLAGLGSVVTAALAGCSAVGLGDGDDDSGDGDDADAALRNASFEDDLTGWTVGSDLPEVPGGQGDVDHGVETVTREAADGEAAVELYISGVADDGTIWVQQPVDFSGVDAVSVAAFSRQVSFNQIAQVAFFAGEVPEGGLAEADFDRDYHFEEHEGWERLEYDVSDLEGEATLAVGMNVIWETEVRRLLDDVRLIEAED